MDHLEGLLKVFGGVELFYQCWQPEEAPKAEYLKHI